MKDERMMMMKPKQKTIKRWGVVFDGVLNDNIRDTKKEVESMVQTFGDYEKMQIVELSISWGEGKTKC
jgi:hypothetical protein